MHRLLAPLALIPFNRRLLGIIWPFLAIVVLLVVLGGVSMDILSSARAFVGGESLWSKGQKEAVYYLSRYAESHAEADYHNFQQAIAVPLGDRKARLELSKHQPDLAVAAQGFIEGRNHPDDIDGLIRLFRRFGEVSFMAEAIAIWAEGDRYIAELDRVAAQLHQLILSGETSAERLRPIVGRLQTINAELTPLEEQFSQKLGEASRKTQIVLLVAMLLVASILVLLGTVLSRRMVANSAAFENALRLSEERFNLAVKGSNDGLWDWNVLTRDIYYSPRVKELLGYADDEIVSTLDKSVEHIHPEDADATRQSLQDHLRDGRPYDAEFRLRTKSGEYRWFRSRGQSVRDGHGRSLRMAGSITDITDRKLAEAQLFAEKERAQVTLESIGDAVITTNIDGQVDYLNPVAEALTGWTTAEACGRPLRTVCLTLNEVTGEPVQDPIAMVLRAGRGIELGEKIVLMRRGGGEIAVDESAAPIRDRAGQITGVVLVLHDVSRERQHAAQLSYQASHDALTGLINRREFEYRLDHALKSGREKGGRHAVMYLDLDQFKVVNDTCGHAAGDELMRQISLVLQRGLRDADTLARLGGDEFGVLLQHCGPAHALRIGEELRGTIAAFHFVWHERSFVIGASIGLVNIADGTFGLAEVMSAADAACYMAKEKGRNRVQVYNPNDDELSVRHGEMQWVNRIHKALAEERFCLYSQEIVDVRSVGRVATHCELLIRMIDEHGALVPPMAFIPAAERYNLMPTIDRWVIRTAFSTIAALRAQEQAGTIEVYGINLSGASIGDERFLDFVREQYIQFGIAPSTICFEITETAAIANLAKAVHLIEQLRTLGFRFSLDDFGAGMSSFAYLKHLPVDFLKIDGCFVKDMLEDPIDLAMVEAISHIGHVMGKQTIAEFVENEAILERVRLIGIDYAQGYGVSRPRPFRLAASDAKLHLIAVSR